MTSKPQFGSDVPCDLKIDNGDYFGIIKQKGKHNYNFAYMLAYLNRKYFDRIFDGYMITEKYTPYFYSGITLEEFVYFDPYDKLERNIDDQYDWYNYSKYFDFRIPHKFRLPRLFSEYNKNFDLYRFYNQQNYSKKNNELLSKSRNKTSLIYLDVNNFKSLNVNDSVDIVRKELINFIKFMDPSFCVLLNCSQLTIVGYEIKNSYGNDRTMLFYKPAYKNKLDEMRILFIKLKQIKEYSYKRPFFKDFVKTAEINYENNIKQLENLVNFKPQIIFGKFDLTNNSPEFKYLENNDYKTYKLKTSIFPVDKDYVFTNLKTNVEVNLLNYNMSFYLPIHLLIL